MEIFKDEQFGAVRTIEKNGKVLFCVKDIAEALGYSRPRDAIAVHAKGAVKRRILTNGGEQDMTFIPEGDVYRLIARSKLPKAQEFESWVFDEVVPSVVKHGAYMTEVTLENCLNDPDFAIGLLTALKEEREKGDFCLSYNKDLRKSPLHACAPKIEIDNNTHSSYNKIRSTKGQQTTKIH